MKIKLHSPYNHFPNHVPVENEPYIDCYNDSFVTKGVNPNSIALLIEPRPLQPKVYDYIQQHYDKFKYVFTHDSILLNSIPNAKLILWGGIWSWANEDKDFTHPISMVASWKEQAPVRIERKHLALKLKDKIDCYGTFDGGLFATTHDIYAKYPFSIVIENHIDDYWFTEKICNCFANRTVPIYWGARKISDFFDTRGMIITDSTSEIESIVDYILSLEISEVKELYFEKISYINENYYRVSKYQNFETWFYNEYGELLNEMVNNNPVLQS